MNENHMGKRCIYAGQCHIYQGKVKLKHPLFLVMNIFCNNGPRWWTRCNVYIKFNSGEHINNSLIPAEYLRQE